MALVETDNLLCSVLNRASSVSVRFARFYRNRPRRSLIPSSSIKWNKSYLNFSARSFRFIACNYILCCNFSRQKNKKIKIKKSCSHNVHKGHPSLSFNLEIQNFHWMHLWGSFFYYYLCRKKISMSLRIKKPFSVNSSGMMCFIVTDIHL